MNPMPDPVIDEIREIRHRISAMCDHDPTKLVAYFQQIQEQYRDRLITSPRFAPPTTAQHLYGPTLSTERTANAVRNFGSFCPHEFG